jgi:glutamyl-tRNA synthetase
MVNFLALLGWSPGTDQEIFTREELVAEFTLDGVSGSNAVFNPEKLDWMNAQHIARMPPQAIVERIRPLLEAAGLWESSLAGARLEWLSRVIALVVPRVKKLEDFVPQLEPFLRAPAEYDASAVQKHLGAPGLADHVAALADAFQAAPGFDETASEAALRATAESRGIKAGALIHATRVAVTGKAVSPGLFEVLALVGRDEVVARLRALEAFLRTRS